MRLKFLPLLSIALMAMLMMVSCKKSNTQGRYIPATAAVIVHVNAESVSAKLPWEEVKQNDLFIKMYADSSLSSFVKSALDNPENTGIDTKKDMAFFMVKDSAGAYVVFQGAIKDAAKFKTYNTAAIKDGKASEKNGVQFISNEKTTVSWDKDKFMLVTDAPDRNKMNDTGAWMDKMEQQIEKDSMPAPVTAVKTQRNGVTTASDLYNLAEGKSMAKNSQFTELVTTKGDIHFWINAEILSKDTEGLPGMGMVNLSKLSEGSVATGTVNFENGKIDVDMKSYAGKEMTEIWKKYSVSKISSDMVKRLPAKDVALFIAMNFKPEGIKEFVKLTGLEGLINMGAAFLGFNLDDFVKANKGDILLAVSDIAKDSSGKTNASVLFAASVGDKASFEKLINAGKKGGKQGLGNMASQIHFNSNDQYFAIGNKKENIDQFVTKAGNSTFDFYDKIASSPIGGYANLRYMMSSMRDQVSKDSLALSALDASAKMWENIIMSGGDFKKGGITQHYEINLVDKTTNSLKQLNKYMGTMANIAEQKKNQPNINDLRLPGNTSPILDSAAMVE